MARKPGFFIRSDIPFNRIMEKLVSSCKDLLLEIKPGELIDTFQPHSEYGGVKCFITDATILGEVYKKKFLKVSEENLLIYSLTTNITLHNAVPESDEDFMEETKMLMKTKFGPVQSISKIPLSKEHPNIGSGNWRVVLDIPEMDDLDFFINAGLPDEAVLEFPTSEFNLKMTFFCSICEQDGHATQKCPTVGGDFMAESQASTSELNSEAPKTSSKKSSRFYIRDRTVKSEGSKLIQNKIEAIEQLIGAEEVLDSFKDTGVHGEKGKRSSSKKRNKPAPSVNKPLPKKYCLDKELFKDIVGSDEDSPFGCSSSTTEGDAVQSAVDYSFESPFHRTVQIKIEDIRSSLDLHSAARNEAHEEPGPSNIPTSSQPDIKIKPEPNLTDEDDSETDSLIPKTRVIKKRKPMVILPVILPGRIRDIVREHPAVLNIAQLEAFFTHVKKKSNPSQFATFYTSDVAGLKKQLLQISQLYYNTRMAGTPDDIKFMKWFGGFLQRFDGTPSRRRRRNND